MNEEEKITEQVIDSISDSDNKRETYPIRTFKSIEGFMGNIYKKYGDSDVLSNEKIADANNLSVNSIKQTLSTCQQYSCLRKIHGKGYKITEAFTTIYHPEDESEKFKTIIECIKGVPFYVQLFIDFTEKIVPSIEGLQNRFIRTFGMKPHIAKNAVEIFIQNLKDFNLLNARGVLIFKNDFKLQSPTVNEPLPPEPQIKNNVSIQNLTQNEDQVNIPIKLKGGKIAYLSFPIDFTDDDLQKIFKVVKAYIEAYGDNIKLT